MGNKRSRNITSQSRSESGQEGSTAAAGSFRDKLAATVDENAERRKIFGTCVNTDCTEGPNKTRKTIHGAPYGYHDHGMTGTCCAACETVHAKKPKYPDHPESLKASNSKGPSRAKAKRGAPETANQSAA